MATIATPTPAAAAPGAPVPAAAPVAVPAAAAAAPGAGPQAAAPTPAAAAPAAGAEATPPAAAAAAPGAGGAQDDKGSKDGAATASEAPEKYDLRLPEGAPRIPPAAMAQFENRMREAGVSNEGAQALLDQSVQQIAELHAAQTAAWEAETSADPTYGGANLEATKTRCSLALDKLLPTGTPYGDQLRELLSPEGGGYGNHPAIVAFLANTGRLLEEASPKVTQAGAQPARKSTAQVLFGDPPTPGVAQS